MRSTCGEAGKRELGLFGAGAGVICLIQVG